MKKFFIGLLLVIVIAAGAFMYMVQKHASATEEVVKKAIAKFNEENMGADFSYDTLSVDGTPMAYNVTFENPVLTYDNSAVVKMIAPNMDVEGHPDNWKTKIKHDGKAVLTGHYLSDELSLTLTGGMAKDFTVGGIERRWVSSWEGDNACTLTFDPEVNFSTLSPDMFSQMDGMSYLFKHVDGIACSSGNSK